MILRTCVFGSYHRENKMTDSREARIKMLFSKMNRNQKKQLCIESHKTRAALEAVEDNLKRLSNITGIDFWKR